MINISLQNPSSTQSFKNKWIDGFTFSTIINTVGMGGFGPNPIDYEQLQLKGTLKRNGQEIELFNHTLKNLVILGNIKSPTYNFLNSNTVVYLNALGQTALSPIRFDLGGPINLIGNDEFILEWTLNTTYFNTVAGVVPSTSYITVDETETCGVEYFVPITRSKVIEGSQDNPTYSLGDNVMTIVLANYDKTDFLTANQVVKTIRLKSDKVNKNDDFNELITKSMSYYSTASEAGLRLQNWVIYDGADELDNVDLNISTNSANVVSSKNYVLWRTFYTDNWLVTRAETLRSALDSKADKKGTFNPALLSTSSI